MSVYSELHRWLSLTSPTGTKTSTKLHPAAPRLTERLQQINSRMWARVRYQNKTNCIFYCYSHELLTWLEADHLTSGVRTVSYGLQKWNEAHLCLFTLSRAAPAQSRSRTRCYRTQSDLTVHITMLRSVCFEKQQHGCCYQEIRLSSWPIKHPGGDGEVFCSNNNNYFITINRQRTRLALTPGERGCFQEGDSDL